MKPTSGYQSRGERGEEANMRRVKRYTFPVRGNESQVWKVGYIVSNCGTVLWLGLTMIIILKCMKWSEAKWSHSVVSDSLWPHGLWPTRLLHPWNFPGQSTGVGCLFFSRGSSWPRAWIQVSHTAGRCFTIWATREACRNTKSLCCVTGTSTVL